MTYVPTTRSAPRAQGPATRIHRRRPNERPSAARRAGRVGWRQWNLVGVAALTAYSTALGWQAQLVSYPLFSAVGPDDFADYHAQYNDSIPFVVVLPGIVGFTAAAAFYWTRPSHASRGQGVLVSATGIVCLLTTGLWAIPMHDRLDRVGQSDATIDGLLGANLVRTLALTVGTLTLSWCLATTGTLTGRELPRG